MERETIYGVMVTGKPGRQRLAQCAVESWRRQRYQNRVLIIVNDGDYRLDLSGVHAVEVTVPAGQTLGDLRNVAINAVPDGGIWVQWDDDDWRHPNSVWFQYHALGDAVAVQLDCQVQYSFGRDAGWTVLRRRGIEGTIMARQVGVRYERLAKGEDTRFRDALAKAGRVIVTPNLAHDYLRFIHLANTWDAAHFNLDRHPIGERSMDRASADYLEQVLDEQDHYRALRTFAFAEREDR